MAVIDNAQDLRNLWQSRAFYYGRSHQVMDDLVGVYNGVLPSEFDDFFHEDMHVHLINSIRLAWDDLAALAGRVFQLYVRPDNDTDTATNRAEKQEQIGYGYNRAGRLAGSIDMDLLMKVLMWWVVGCANAVAMALPDYRHQSPYFTFRDPRTHYPPVGWNPYTQTKLEDSVFAYQMSVAELKARFPEQAASIGKKVGRLYPLAVPGGSKNSEDEVFLWVGEYYHADCWMTATLEDSSVLLAKSETGDPGHPGVMPVVPFGLFNPDTAKGRSFFADQISIQAAMARMFSQKLDYFDRTLYPVVFTTPLMGRTLKIGPYAVNEYDIANTQGSQPRLDTIAPANPVDADQTIQMALGLSRMLNRNPEAFQGAGEADSAKALTKLTEGVDRVVRNSVWPAAISALPVLYSTAAQMDLNLWPNVQKKAKGDRKGTPFRVTYRPAVDLADGRAFDFEVETPITVGGYQGVLQTMQLVQAELLSEDTAFEQLDDIPNAKEEKRRVDLFRIKKLALADLQAKTGNGVLAPGTLKAIADAIRKGEDIMDAIDRLEKEGKLTIQMPMGPEAAPMGGAGAPPDIVPTLDAIRRGM